MVTLVPALIALIIEVSNMLQVPLPHEPYAVVPLDEIVTTVGSNNQAPTLFFVT